MKRHTLIKMFLDYHEFKIKFIALIHPIQWTIANLVGADRPVKQQKKLPYMCPL